MVVFENGKIKIGKSLPIFGVLMIVAGVWTWCHPDAVLLAMALYVGIVFLAGGIGYVHSFFQSRSGAWLALGLLNIVISPPFCGIWKRSEEFLKIFPQKGRFVNLTVTFFGV